MILAIADSFHRGRATLRKLAGFGRAKEGVAVVEFAAILPLMLLMYLGTIEIGQAVAINRRVTQVSRTISDLVAQYESAAMTTSQMTKIWTAANHVLAPWPQANAKFVVSSVKRINASTTQVVWSRANGTGAVARAAGSPVTLPTGLLANDGDTVIMGEVTYRYQPVVGYFIKSAFDVNETTYMTPRAFQEITFP